MTVHQIRHDIELRDVTDSGLLVSHNRVCEGRTYTEAQHTSDHLPLEFLSLFSGGTVDVCDLTREERQWIETEATQIEIEEAL